MPNLDDRIREDLRRAIREEPDLQDLFTVVSLRRARRKVRRKVGMAALTLVVIATTIGGFLALRHVFREGAGPATSPTPTPSASVAACGVSIAHAPFEGPSTPDGTVTIRCDHAGGWVMDVAWGSGASAIRPLTPCVTSCEVYATPDLDGDGTAELAVLATDPSVSPFPFVVFYRLPSTEPDPAPLTVTGASAEGWDRVFEIGGNDVSHPTISCDANGDLVSTLSREQPDGSWFVRAITLTLRASGFDVIDDRSGRWFQPFDPGSAALCGSDVIDPTAAAPPFSPTSLPGVPFDVCNVQAVHGSFGDGPNGVAYVFEERPAGMLCNHGSEGFQHVAVAPDGDTVTSISPRLLSCVPTTKCWLFATPDIDGDGVDEIAVADGGSPEEVEYQLYRVDLRAGAIPGVNWCRGGPCQPGDGFPLFWGARGGPTQRAGVECVSLGGAPFLISYEPGPSRGVAYAVLPDRLQIRTDISVADPLLPDVTHIGTSLCGSGVDDFVPFLGR